MRFNDRVLAEVEVAAALAHTDLAEFNRTIDVLERELPAMAPTDALRLCKMLRASAEAWARAQGRVVSVCDAYLQSAVDGEVLQ